MTDYPKRPRFFANKSIRLMLKSCVAQELGQGTFALLVAIVTTEDVRRYVSPPTFWNESLAAIAGFANAKAMCRQRDRAVEAGWLHYEPGGNRIPGTYWLTIPAQLDALSDLAFDGDSEVQFPVQQSKMTLEVGTEVGVEKVQQSNLTVEVGTEPGMNRERSGNRTGNEVGTFHSYTLPTPNPIDMRPPVPPSGGKARTSQAHFSKPTLEEIRAYCLERQNHVDPEKFYDHYEANGWKVGRAAMKDWRASVRTWEKNNVASFGAGSARGPVIGAGQKFGAPHIFGGKLGEM